MKRNKKFRDIFILLAIFSGLNLFSFNFASASTTDGIIDSTYKYAWSNNGGWINFGATNGNIHITDSGITGYAWNENYGWINMSPTYGGVQVSSSGALSGYAWGENAGWINFSGASINCSGQFIGTATGDTIGTITFTCTNCSVITDYRPQACRGGGSGGGGGGGGGPYCGDGTCNGAETCVNCSQDCGLCIPVCGDGKCEAPENCEACQKDCGECKPPPFCGDGFCKDNETCKNCPQDCGKCLPVCGDGFCKDNETCKNCPDDCGECKTIKPFCGDKICNNNENCKTCREDCGQCITILPIIPPIIPFSSIDITTKTISTVSLMTTVVATAFASPLSLPELFLIPTRLLGALLVAFGWKKRNPPWGVVYDSVTKQPLDPAYVALKDSEGKDISSAITDLDGRYGFLIKPGIYKMTANKTNYIFPSQKLAGKTNDELYDNLYFGEPIEIKDRNEAITRNIPLDPLKFDWNEFTKQKNGLTKFYSRWDALLRQISDFVYYIGFVIAVIAFFAAPYPYNTIILCLYLFLLLLRILGVKPKPFGSVIEKSTGNPLTFAIIRVMDPSSNREISQRITDKYGRYFCLVPRGKYYVKIEKKNDDGSYSLVHTSQIIDASKRGIIKNRFRV